jgi:endonuclease/exonuclease/phosphatase (EEP) superfamily protein YafD
MHGGSAAARLTALLGEFAGWSVVAGVGAVMTTQATGWTGSSLVAALQALTPYGIPAVGGVAVAALWQRRYALSIVAAITGLSILGLSLPLISSSDGAEAAERSAVMRVAAINLLFSNPRVDEVANAIANLDADVITFSEFTAEHRDTLLASAIADEYPYQINRDGLYAGGMAVWSRLPISEGDSPDTTNRTIDATIDGPDGTVRIMAVHPPTPIHDLARWQQEIEGIGEAADAASLPTLAIGDFNASYWHPVFRELLDRGLTDAHIAVGQGWSTSWPTDEPFPPFVRLDHAVTNAGLVSTAVEDFDVPGSDHVGFVVTVRMAAN